jgi:hypothetical protein
VDLQSALLNRVNGLNFFELGQVKVCCEKYHKINAINAISHATNATNAISHVISDLLQRQLR